MQKEDRKYGKVELATYGRYLRSGASDLRIGLLLLVGCCQALLSKTIGNHRDESPTRDWISETSPLSDCWKGKEGSAA